MAKYIKLKNGDETIVDDEDFEMLNSHKWSKMTYPVTYIKCDILKRYKTMFMHNIIMPTIKGFQVDHIDRNPLNNQKSNLRICTKYQNALNKGLSKLSKTGYKGVCFKKDCQKFQARICFNKKRISLGYFDTAELAFQAYKEASKKFHGEFASPYMSLDVAKQNPIIYRKIGLQSNNSTGYRGVTINKLAKSKIFRAVMFGKHLGYFDTAELAAEAYNKRALELGKFTWLNVIPNQEQIDKNKDS